MADGQIKQREITEEMQKAYLEYAMSVIISRALPDVRDGLKPVHRRILYAMHEMGLRSSAKYQKCAKVVGNVLGLYHPHGDIAAYDALVRMAQDFSLRYPLIDGQGNFGCFTGDTKIALTDGRDLSFEDLVKESKVNKKHFSFTFNNKTKLIEIAKIKNPRLTKRKAKLVEVELDNGEKIKCTPNHLFMTRDGGYKEAQFLREGDSLTPLYFRLSTKKDDRDAVGYRMMKQPFGKIWDWVHKLADEYNLNRGVYKNTDGKIRHHVDFNKLNNNPDNIRRIDWANHWKLHYKFTAKRHKVDREYVKKLKEGREKFWSNPENKEKARIIFSERSKSWWQDKDYREKRIETVKKLWLNKQYKERMRKISSENIKKLWANPKFKALLSVLKSKELKDRWLNKEYRNYMMDVARDISNRIWANPEHRERVSNFMKEKWSNSEYREKQTQISKNLWLNPAYRANYEPDHFRKMSQVLWSNPETKKLHREKALRQWADPEFAKLFIAGVKRANKRHLEENPDFMKILAAKAGISLRSKWKDPEYKKRVIKSKILRFVKSLMESGEEITPVAYEKYRKNDGTPVLSGALTYFDNFNEIIEQAKYYNHRVRYIRFLENREDVYDLTIEGTHNFALAAGVFVHNSIDGDSAAAYRYTESRLASISEELLADIDKSTVDFTDNFDATTKEPVVLPSKIPNLLINGSMGIAVGMATNIPPHNLGEVLDALAYLIDNRDADVKDLFQFVKGPDFPTGGIIYNENDIINAYATGRGPVVMRGKADIVEDKKGFQIIVTEIPYQTNKAELIVKIADLVKEKKIEGIRDVRDESDKDGLRIAIDLKQDAFPRKVLNQLFKYTELQKAFHFNILALVDGIQPQILGLKALLEKFIEHRREVITRRTKFDLQKAKDRAHILEGLKKALDHIDEIIKLIKASASRDDAFNNLMKKFKFSDKQTNAILEMRLQALAGLERKRVEDELKEKKELIAYLEDLLASPKKVLGVIKDEFKELKEKYGDERKTKVVKSELKEIGEEELVPEEDSLFMLTRSGYIKRIQPDVLRSQRRGGKGLVGIATKEEDVVSQFFMANTHDSVLFFTNTGKVFQTKGYEVPESARQSKGKAIVNFLQISPNEMITAVVPVPKNSKGYLFMATAKGCVKKVDMEELSQVRRNGMLAIKLRSDDQLGWVLNTSGNDQIMMVTSAGNSIRFKEKDVRPMGRSAAGVIGVRLEKDAKVVGADVIPSGAEKELRVLAVMENGFGKRTDLKSYKIQKRGGRGIMTAKVTAKTGKVVSAHVVSEENKELIAVSRKGQVIRTTIESISVLGRATQGVRIMKVEKEDGIASVVCI